MLLQLRDFILREKTVSTQQLARQFKIELSALQPMLDLWLRKGVIRKCQQTPQCGSSCFKCRKGIEYYQSGT